ncbi:SMI1/KNR4 family protein [Catellatospora sp. NPDC049111]|uniref:SMI1/KNR4 family protein n=1 Tax=Catellatospora sp. NPDC049111 TaxID=3155271 RepID=UPI0033D3FDBB
MTEDELLDLLRARVAAAPAWRGPVELATPGAIAEAEHLIGLPLPPLLRRIYLEVANGGFGPRDGVLGVGENAWSDDGGDIVDHYGDFSSAPGHPRGLVPVYEVGCAIWWLLDFRDPAGPMWGWDPGGCCPEHALAPQGLTLADWLAETHDGSEARKIEQPWVCRPSPVWPPMRPPRRLPPADPTPTGPPEIAANLRKRSAVRIPPTAAPRRPAPGRDPRPRWSLSPDAAPRRDEPS